MIFSHIFAHYFSACVHGDVDQSYTVRETSFACYTFSVTDCLPESLTQRIPVPRLFLILPLLVCSSLFCSVLFWPGLVWSGVICSDLVCIVRSALVWSVLVCSGLFCSVLFWSGLFCSLFFFPVLVWFDLFCSGMVWTFFSCRLLFSCHLLFSSRSKPMGPPSKKIKR